MILTSEGKTGRKTPEETHINQIYSDAGIALPPDSKAVYYGEKTDYEPEWIIKVKISEKKLDAVLKQLKSKITRNQLQKGPIAIAKSAKWWKPVEIIINKYYLQDKTGALIYVVISKENDGVYIYIHHMIM